MIEMQISGAGGSKFCLEFCVLGCDLGGHGSAGRVQFCGQLRIGYGQDLSGQNCGVFRAVQRHGGYRDAAGHLHGGKQSVQAVNGSALHGDTNDRQGGIGGKSAGQVCGHAGGADDDANVVFPGGTGIGASTGVR